jgi:hypothetical protein
MSAYKIDEAAVVFKLAQETQAAFWRTLNALEQQLGHEIDGSQDLNDTTLEALRAEQA